MGFEPTISAGEGPQTYALDRAATGTGHSTGWTQKHSLISSSYKIKTYYWETWLPFSARWGAAALASRCPHISQRALAKQMDWPRWTKWPGVLQVAPEITGPDRLWLLPLGARERHSLCTSITRNRGRTAGTHHCSSQVGHAGYAAESLVRARLSHRCLPSNKTGAHWVCVIPHETVWVNATVATNFVRIFQ